MTEYIPLGTKVLLKKLPKKEVPQKILTLNEPKDRFMAEVVGCGLNVSDIFEAGFIVRYDPYSVRVIDEDNPNFLIVDEKDIWCIVRE